LVIIGLTGGIGAGKSTVAAMLAELGASVIDTDAIAREVVQPPSPVLDAIKAEFGPGVINPDGTLKRDELGRLVFADAAKRKRLNELTHPAILKATLERIAAQPREATIVVVVPLLFESGFERNCDAVIAVTAGAAIRRARIAARDGLKPEEIEARLLAQLPDAEYDRRATIAVRNDGDKETLRRQVAQAWEKIRPD
jgi:dephospho-CoA kinase